MVLLDVYCRCDIRILPAGLIGSLQGQAVTIQNQAGTVLPSTGGIGTTIFYVIGGAMVITAGVLLVTKRRLSKIED